MATATPAKRERPVEAEEIHPTEAIADNVLAMLGRPGSLHDVQVRPVGKGTYRVNIRTTCPHQMSNCVVETMSIPHSYYIRTDGVGRILESSPVIKRLY
jgi:hypothetical protein